MERLKLICEIMILFGKSFFSGAIILSGLAVLISYLLIWWGVKL